MAILFLLLGILYTISYDSLSFTAIPENEFTSIQLPIHRINQLENDAKVEDQLNSSNFSRKISDREQQRISDIREEIVKLRNLIEILKDQQYILKSLDNVNNEKYRLDTKETVTTPKEVEMTEFKNLVEIDTEEKFLQKINNFERKLSKLDNFKGAILKAIGDERISRINWENHFEAELNKIKKDFVNTKHLIFKILRKILKHKDTDQTIQETHNDTNFNAILTKLKALEKNITTFMEKGDLVDENTKKNLETSVEDPLLLKTRAGSARTADEDDLDDVLTLLEKEERLSNDKRDRKIKLKKLLKELDESEIDSTEALVNEHKDSADSIEDNPETVLELINLLKRFRKTEFPKHHQDKTESTNKKLKILLKELLNEPESKISKDDELISNLKELSEEINNLRPKDDVLSNEGEDNASFKTFLEKLMNTNLPKQKLSTTPKPTLTQKQIAALISQLTKMANKNTNKGEVTETQQKEFYSNVPLYGTYKCEKLLNNQQAEYTEQGPQNGQHIQDLHTPYHQHGIAEYENMHQQGLNQLFRGYQKDGNQLDGYPQTFDSPQYSENIFDTLYSPKYATNPQEDHASTERRVQNLSAQINNLKFALNHLNRPEYIQTDEDKAALQNLNWQTDNLQHIIHNLLNGATVPHYQSYDGTYSSQTSFNDNSNQPHLKHMKPYQNYATKYLNRDHSQPINYDSQSHINLQQHQPSHSSYQYKKSNTHSELPDAKRQNLFGKIAAEQKDKIEINRKEDDFIGRRRRSTHNEGLNSLNVLLNSILENITDTEEQNNGKSTKTEDFGTVIYT